MRFGVLLRDRWPDDAVLAEELGFDLVWIDESDAPAPLAVAAAVAPRTSGIRIVTAVAAGPNPVTLAEEAAVADLASGGRLVLALGGDDEALLRESVELLFHAFAARPFRHEGPRWPTPARLPEHERAEQRIRVTPPPAQLELPIWLRGEAACAVARAGNLAFVAEGPGAAAEWSVLDVSLGLAARRLRRPALRPLDVAGDGALDADALVAALRREQDAWGLDVAVLAPPAGLAPAAHERCLRTVATAVRPRLQLDRLPDGLDAYWRTRSE